MQGISYENQKVMVLAPHADDETLGCGGVIQKYLSQGSPVRVCIASFLRGSTIRYMKRANKYKSYEGDIRLHELQKCMSILGVTDYHILFMETADNNQYHSKLDMHPRIHFIEMIEQHITDFQPTVMYLPSITKHQDHEVFHQAAIAAARPYFWNGSLFVYETDGELSFQPNLYVPLSEQEMERKIKALQAYQTQVQGSPHPVSPQAIEDKAKFRGSHLFVKYAEAFEVLRIHG